MHTQKKVDEVAHKNYPSYFQYWGKARKKETGEIKYHPLVLHSLDVSAVGYVFLKNNLNLLNKLAVLSGLTEKQFHCWFTFMLALHDVGKFADSFQNLKPDILKQLQHRESKKVYNSNFRHDSLGLVLWNKYLKACLQQKELIPKTTGSYRRQTAYEQPVDIWMSAVTGHHGQPPKSVSNHSLSCDFHEPNDYNAACEFLEDLVPVLFPDRVAFPSCCNKQTRIASWSIAGLAVMCDWLGSNTDFFPYQTHIQPLAEYWITAKQKAENVTNKISILNSKIHQNFLWTDLLKQTACVPQTPKKTTQKVNLLDNQNKEHSSDQSENSQISITNNTLKPSPLQLFASQLKITSSPHLFIVEDVTGSGKTETALLLAHKLMKANQAKGIYFALPTMATSNAMYSRFKTIYTKMFRTGTSLVLSHSARDMVKEFQQSILPEIKEAESHYGDKTFPAGFHCKTWLADNRKKAFLADIGVGTIDQALLAILPAKHQSLRLFGLLDKILIVDEVHAYDSYTGELLKILLSAHASMGGSAILLSATLPINQRQKLLDSYARRQNKDCQKLSQNAYPLLTKLTNEELSEYPLATRNAVKRRLFVESLSESSFIDTLFLKVIEKNLCACWIRNTVADAIESYQKIKKKYPDWNVTLFHARYALGDRLNIEKEVIHRFGKSSRAENRKKQILIATQVVEQSLDLDFDVLISDLAPVDLLIQRAGRLKRHTRNKAGNLVQGADQRTPPCLYVYSPQWEKEPDKNWYAGFFKKAKDIYPYHGQLWLTARLIQRHSCWKIPEDSRNLIEDVYGEDAQNDIPEGLMDQNLKAEGEASACASQAGWNTLSIEGGYKDTDSNWKDEGKIVTRLGEETTTVYLAKYQNGLLQPWINDKDYAWSLSAVSIKSSLVNEGNISSDIPQNCIEQCKKTLPAEGKWSFLLPLTYSSDNKWKMTVQTPQKERYFTYSQETGLKYNG